MREMSRCTLIERSIIKKYRKQLWNPFIAAVKRYRLIQAHDKIAVCISGGKDSMLLAKLMQQLQRHSEVPFELVFLAMDPGYNRANRQKIEENARIMEIPVTFFDSEIFDIANTVQKSPCYLCARMRRGHLYANAKELGCNKIALGHHMSDVIETTLMGMMYGSQIQGMLPRLSSTNFEGMELIRPMYCILEDDIISWRDHNSLSFLQCACRFTENIDKSGDGIGESKRQEIKQLIKDLRKVNPNVEHNLFESIHNVSVDTLVEYKLGGETHSFLERFKGGGEDIL
ncbi:MAG: tRNA 2-thiocytidine biosynthesis protein TtcA [Ruminococcaceae bacterium]|nr:tRNA 2-thiocytidine biosynthesis protein TtcA [Oscillospiraceae bacterium]